MKRLIPEPQVRKRYGVTQMTLWRWDRDPTLGFPKPVVIRRRKYRDADELDAFDADPARREAPIFGEKREEASNERAAS
jgi:hypothetical protein